MGVRASSSQTLVPQKCIPYPGALTQKAHLIPIELD